MNNNDNLNNIIRFDQIISLSNGVDESGIACSSASLSLDQIKDDGDDVNNKKDVFLKDAELNTYFSGGCLVVEATLPSTSTFEYTSIVALCNEWFGIAQKEKDLIISMTMVPYRLMGEVILLFSGLAYFTSYKDMDKYKCIFCFDNEATQVFVTDEIDYKAIALEVEEELKDEENKLVEEIAEVENETKEIEKNNNMYAQYVKDNINNIATENDDEETSKNKMIRHTME